MLTARALGRATLARQLLLERAAMAPLDAVRHLVGMQAQVPLNPYVGLWSRLVGFEPVMLARLLEERALVRTVVMRATIHLVTADDCLGLRPLMQLVLDAELVRHRDYGPRLRDVDLEPVLVFIREVLAQRPRSGAELRALLADRFPDEDAAALAYGGRCLLPLVQVPPRGVWGKTGQVRVTTAEAWLAGGPTRRPSIDEVVLRYLRAFGPATVADVSTWCRLTGMREVVERLRPGLQSFRDENGHELFDVPDGLLPDPETPAPVRFLPEYDNVLLSHADRSRFGLRRQVWGLGQGVVLADGVVGGTWWVEKGTGRVRLAGEGAADEVEAERERLERFLRSE